MALNPSVDFTVTEVALIGGHHPALHIHHLVPGCGTCDRLIQVRCDGLIQDHLAPAWL